MTTQRTITVAEYIEMTDMLSEVIQVLFTALGDEETPSSAAAEASDFRDYVVAMEDPDEALITADFIDVAIAMVTDLAQESRISSYFSSFNAAVLTHLGTDLNTWLTADGTRVHHLYRRGGNASLDPVNVFPPVTVMGTVATSAENTCEFTADPDTDGEVDTATYADAQLEVVVINQQFGAAQAVYTITGTDFEGEEAEATATVTTGAAQDAKFDVGTSSDRFATVTEVTVSGGTNGDDIRIQTKEDRTL